jgi:hypothetical protein
VALTDSDLSDLLVALKAGEMNDTIRTSLEWILQQLIEVEAAVAIGVGPTSAPMPAPPSRNGTDHGCCPPQPAPVRRGHGGLRARREHPQGR